MNTAAPFVVAVLVAVEVFLVVAFPSPITVACLVFASIMLAISLITYARSR